MPIRTKYSTFVDWNGKNYCGYELKWNYPDEYVDVPMPTYISKFLKKFNDPKPKLFQKAPHVWTELVNGQNANLLKPSLNYLPLINSELPSFSKK